MEELNTQYVKRTQKDYSLSFKLAVVKKIEGSSMIKIDVMQKCVIQDNATTTCCGEI